MTAVVNTASTIPTTIPNALSPPEEPKALPMVLDFSASTSYSYDTSSLQQQGYMSWVQALFVDNSLNSSNVVIAVVNGMAVSIPANSQGFIPIACPKSATLLFTSAGAVIVKCTLFNVPMPSTIWSVTASPALPVTGGKLQVQDTTLESAIVSGLMQSQLVGLNGTTPTPIIVDASGRVQIQPGEPITLTAANIASATGASQVLMAANAARQYLYIKAPETADLWLHPLGGVASVGGAGCIKIPQGTFYESHAYAWAGAINVITTATLVVTAYQG